MTTFYRITLFIGVTVCMLASNVQAQDLPRLSQYMFNRLVYNPAAAGTGDATLNASALARLQWVGTDGAPRYYLAWGDYRFTDNRMALGLNINHSTYSLVKNTDFQANYAYQVPLTRKLKLSMGLRAGLSSTTVSSDPSRVWDQNDPFVNSLNSSAVYAKIGAGFHLYSSRFYLGFSVPDLYVSNKNEVFRSSNNRNYIAYAGGIIRLNDTYRLLPSMIFYSNPLYDSRLDGTLLLEVKDYVWAGGSATTTGQFVLTAGTCINSRLRLSYAYEFAKPGSTGSFSTHEFNLRFSIDNLFKKSKIK